MSESLFIHPAEARRRFREFAEGDIGNADLARGALLIALEDYPQLDMDHYLRALDDLAGRAVGRGRAGEPAVFRLGHLHAEMFDVDRYGGNGDHYYDLRNAYLNEVIDRKVGLPILLSIIFLHVAERIGLTVHGVGLPGHFIVKVQFELNELYVDPFHGGTTLTIAEIGELVGHASGGEVKLAAEHLRSWDARQTLVRVLANMQNMWARAGDARKAASARERRMLLDTSPRAN